MRLYSATQHSSKPYPGLASVETFYETDQLTREKRKLHEETIFFKKEEDRFTGLVIGNLQKISDMRLHLEMGYSSLFHYATKALGYSEGCAYRRIQCVKVANDVPEVKEKLNSGELNLMNVALAQNFFKLNGATVEEKREVISKIEGCTKVETEKVLAEYFEVKPEKKKEKVRHFHNEEASLNTLLQKEVLENLDWIKSFCSHKDPTMAYAGAIKIAAQFFREKNDPMLKALKKRNDNKFEEESKDIRVTEKSQPSIATNQSRHVSTKIKTFVWQRDEGQCTFTDKKSGRRCTSKHLLQMDHIKPYCYGGEASQQNLSHAHHRLRDMEFGN